MLYECNISTRKVAYVCNKLSMGYLLYLKSPLNHECPLHCNYSTTTNTENNDDTIGIKNDFRSY